MATLGDLIAQPQFDLNRTAPVAQPTPQPQLTPAPNYAPVTTPPIAPDPVRENQSFLERPEVQSALFQLGISVISGRGVSSLGDALAAGGRRWTQDQEREAERQAARIAQAQQIYNRRVAERQFQHDALMDTRGANTADYTAETDRIGTLGDLDLRGRDLTEDARQADVQAGLARDRLGLDRDRLGLDRDRLGLDTELGRGNLELENRRLAETARRTDAQRELDRLLGQGALDVDRHRAETSRITAEAEAQAALSGTILEGRQQIADLFTQATADALASLPVDELGSPIMPPPEELEHRILQEVANRAGASGIPLNVEFMGPERARALWSSGQATLGELKQIPYATDKYITFYPQRYAQTMQELEAIEAQRPTMLQGRAVRGSLPPGSEFQHEGLRPISSPRRGANPQQATARTQTPGAKAARTAVTEKQLKDITPEEWKQIKANQALRTRVEQRFGKARVRAILRRLAQKENKASGRRELKRENTRADTRQSDTSRSNPPRPINFR